MKFFILGHLLHLVGSSVGDLRRSMVTRADGTLRKHMRTMALKTEKMGINSDQLCIYSKATEEGFTNLQISKNFLLYVSWITNRTEIIKVLSSSIITLIRNKDVALSRLRWISLTSLFQKIKYEYRWLHYSRKLNKSFSNNTWDPLYTHRLFTSLSRQLIFSHI